MSDFFKRMAEQGTTITGVGPGGAQCDIGIGADGKMTSNWSGDLTDLTPSETCKPGTYLEQAVEKALAALQEIVYYAQLNRPSGCLFEAEEALALIRILDQQHKDSKGEVAPDQPGEGVDE